MKDSEISGTLIYLVKYAQCIGNNDISDRGIISLIYNFKYFPFLTRLNLASISLVMIGCGITSKCENFLSENVKYLTSLKEINLNGNL